MSDSTNRDQAWRALYPFTSHVADVGGVGMHYVDEGEGDAVVMVHGNPTWSFYYRRLIGHLSGSGFRAIAPDHIGCGLSDKPQDYPYRLATHVDNLEELLDRHLGLTRTHLVLHDWGGAIGMGYAVRHPERIGRVVVLNTAAFHLPRCPWRIRLCMVPCLGEVAVRLCNGFARAALRMATRRRELFTRAVRSGYLAPYRTYRDRVAHLAFVRDIPLGPSHPTWPILAGIDEGLGELKDKPVLACWGLRDFVFTEEFLEGWRTRFPNAQVHRFPDAGHYVLEDAHEAILPMIEQFLGSGLPRDAERPADSGPL